MKSVSLSPWILLVVTVYILPTCYSLPKVERTERERRLDAVEEDIKAINKAITRLVHAVGVVKISL